MALTTNDSIITRGFIKTFYDRLKSMFVLKDSVSASGNRAADSVVSAAAQGQVNSSKYAITQYSTTTTDNVVKARMEYNATTSAIDFNFV